MADNFKYIIISSVRNEGKYMENTINSVISQTLLPLEWIIVNDGSTDNTDPILKQYVHKYPWIKVHNISDRGFDLIGQGVTQAFNYGVKLIQNCDWEYIVKLDGDLSLPNSYFEELIRHFTNNSSLGIAGGSPWYVNKRGIVWDDKMAYFIPPGSARMYRKRCFFNINGLAEVLGWDIIDIIRARMNGWQTMRCSDLKIVHYRMMESRNGLWTGKFRKGRYCYIVGYHPLFFFLRSFYRAFKKPYFIECIASICGYIKSMCKAENLVVTSDEKNFLRRMQIKRLLGIKLLKK